MTCLIIEHSWNGSSSKSMLAGCSFFKIYWDILLPLQDLLARLLDQSSSPRCLQRGSAWPGTLPLTTVDPRSLTMWLRSVRTTGSPGSTSPVILRSVPMWWHGWLKTTSTSSELWLRTSLESDLRWSASQRRPETSSVSSDQSHFLSAWVSSFKHEKRL